jgi:hypothetical protein
VVSRWVVAMVAVGGYKDVQCKEVGVDFCCVTDLAEMNFATWPNLLLAGKYHVP